MRTLSDIRHLFLDMDGTIYHGGRLYPTTLPFLRFLANRKIGVTFLSNNSSYSTKQYVEKLRAMGIDAEPENVADGAAANAFLPAEELKI